MAQAAGSRLLLFVASDTSLWLFVASIQAGTSPQAPLLAFEGFGHEAAHQTVFASKSLDQKLEEPRIIGGFQGVGLVHQIDLELPQAAFRNGSVSGNIHCFTGIIKISEEVIELIKSAQ